MVTQTVSWKVEVQADNTRSWSSNQLRFATEEEAQQYGRDLFTRWTAVREWRTARSDDPVSHRMHLGVAINIEEENTHGEA
jgi:hypothetical protein